MSWIVVALVGCAGPDDPCAGVRPEVFFEDVDRDGFGDPESTLVVCPAALPTGWVASADDCDPLRPEVHPGAQELCDGLDNDCDAAIDDGLPFRDWFVDEDGDGWGTVETRVRACFVPPGAAEQPGDCDDLDASVHPGAVEVCGGVDEDCDGLVDDDDPDRSDDVLGTWHPDLDGDGYGAWDVAVTGCVQPPGTVPNDADCWDANPWVNPAGIEACDGIDNDCDGLIDDSDPSLVVQGQTTWYADVDQDGFGDPTDPLVTCTTPWYHSLDGTDCDDTDPRIGGAGTTVWAADLDGDGVGASPVSPPGCVPPTPLHVVVGPEGLDCDDVDPTVSPLQTEVCNDRDDDCDGLMDDADPDRVSSTLWFPDEDGDGHGGAPIAVCVPAGPIAASGGDCDDGDPSVFPGALEVCNGGVDDDCNGFADDGDPFADRSGGVLAWLDQDGDGYGAAGTGIRVCAVPDGRVEDASDCADWNPALGPPIQWWPDVDGDGYGAGELSPLGCTPPGPAYAMPSRGEDCADDVPGVHPGAVDTCDDGVDQDCDGADSVCPRESCRAWLEDGFTASGVYTVDPLGEPRDVWCDMVADGGGWTLVSSSNDPVDDERAAYSPLLTTLAPTGAMTGLWDGMRTVAGPYGDIRFACSLDPAVPGMRVDLVFYDIHWYVELTSGTDEEVCFSEDDGAGADLPPPRRKNLLTGAVRAEGNAWGAGYLEGEDLCTSRDDFTVDFDDRGMDSNQFDGTDWGEDDDLVKCGVTGQGAAWYVFVR